MPFSGTNVYIRDVTDFDGGTAVIASDQAVFIQHLNAPLTVNADASAHDLYSVEIAPAVNQNIGSDGTPFYVSVSNTTTMSYPPPYFLNKASGGTLFLRPAAAGIDNLILMGTGATRLQTDGTVSILVAKSGTLHVAEGCAITTGYLYGGSVTMPDSSSTDPTTWRQYGGSIWTERGLGSAYIYGGTAMLDSGSNNYTLLEIGGTADVTIKGAGTITTFNGFGGTLHPEAIDRAITITNSTVNITLPWAEKFLNHRLVTFTNNPTLIGA